jgi:hypothetical protein
MVVNFTPAWGIETTTSSLGAMSPYHQANARGALHPQIFYNQRFWYSTVRSNGLHPFNFIRLIPSFVRCRPMFIPLSS